MSDHASILRAFDHAKADALPAVLATVVGTSGSTYRKPGARMLLVADGTRVGVVSGGCLEADVARRAWFLKAPGEVELVRYDTGTGDDATYEFGLGCRGVVEVLLERLDTNSPNAASDPLVIRALRRAVDDRRSTTFATFTRGPRLGERVELGCCRNDALVDEDAIAEVIEPPVQLLIFGSGVDVAPVIRIANAVGWQTIVIDARHRPGNVAEAHRRFEMAADRWIDQVIVDAHTAAVIMTHRMDDDASYLRSLVATEVAYVGCLGPASRTEALLDQLALDGVSVNDARRSIIHAPVGLDLGGERPEEIALSIIAEIQAALTHAAAGPLRLKIGPIHGQADRLRIAASAV